MTIKTFSIIFFAVMFASCNTPHIEEKPKTETPKALQDKTASLEVASKRIPGDLVEKPYNEMMTNDIALNRLEDKVNELNECRGDSANPFNRFNNKNQSYYHSADNYVLAIKDSLLRNKMKHLVAGSLAKYNTQIAENKDLLKVIEAKSVTISDLHNMLKIVKTLPLIENYQKSDLPDIQPLEGYIKRQYQVISLADSLSKK